MDAVICGHINLAPLAVLAGKRYRAPTAMIIHGIDAWSPPARWASRAAVHWIDGVAAVSALTLSRFEGWSGFPHARGYVLPNTFERSELGPGPKSEALMRRYGLDGKRVLMTFGRLAGRDRAKGFDEVLELLPSLHREQPQLNLAYVIAGDGPDRHRLEEKVGALGLRDCVVFTGMVPEAEKADHYRLADVFVMPSRGEGFGIVFLESLACGTPCIGSKVDGSREALRDGLLGRLVDPDDANDLRAAILEGLAKPREVPEGLSFFERPAYEARAREFLDVVIARGRRGR
jgi:glycosyltransferase involved in cell wall biosynthesis